LKAENATLASINHAVGAGVQQGPIAPIMSLPVALPVLWILLDSSPSFSLPFTIFAFPPR
jgi:hypothetical protein